MSKELFSTRLVQIVLRWKFLSKVVIHDITEDPKETILSILDEFGGINAVFSGKDKVFVKINTKWISRRYFMNIS